MPGLKDFTDAMNATWPVALATAAGCGGVLGAHAAGLSYLQAVPDWALATAFVVGLFSGAILLVAVLRTVVSWIGGMRAKRAIRLFQQSHVAGLEDLPDEERYVLGWVAAQNTKVFHAPADHPIVDRLVAKRYVVRHSGTHAYNAWPFHVPDHIWKALRAKYGIEALASAPSPFYRQGMYL